MSGSVGGTRESRPSRPRVSGVRLVAAMIAGAASGVLLAALAGGVLGADGAALHHEQPGALAPIGRSVRAGADVQADSIATLHRWDQLRAAAYASGRADRLARLYGEGSSAGAADMAVLKSYGRRGLAVSDLRMQILRVDVLSAGPTRLVMRVTDRLAGGMVTGHGKTYRLPTDHPSTRVIRLDRRGEAAWTVTRVSR